MAGRLTTNAATAQALYYLTVEVDNKKVTVLCDTGASVSLITIKEVRRLKLEVKPLRNEDEQVLFTADGKKMRPLGKVNVEMDVQGCKFDFELYVMQNLNCNAILGLDFMVYTNCKLDFGLRTAVLFDGSVTASLATKFRHTQTAYLAHNQAIQPFTEVIIPLSLPKPWKGSETCMLQPIVNNTQISEALMIGHVIVKPHGRTVWACMCNASSEPIHIRRNTMMEEVSELQDGELIANISTSSQRSQPS